MHYTATSVGDVVKWVNWSEVLIKQKDVKKYMLTGETGFMYIAVPDTAV